MKWFNYLPVDADISGAISRLKAVEAGGFWDEAVRIARTNFDFTKMLQLDRAVCKAISEKAQVEQPLRLAILASATVNHLLPGIRVAGARHNQPIEIYCHDYGLAIQSLVDQGSELHHFKPEVVLVSWTATQLLGSKGLPLNQQDLDCGIEDALQELRTLRELARNAFNCAIIQQALLPVAQTLVGNNEHVLPGAPLRIINAINERLRSEAIAEKFDMLSLDYAVLQQGLDAWHDPSLWHRAKQEISPGASAYYGELLMRLISAQRGRSFKCVVLDLDNTLWGGVIGDDGLDGIKLGQGNPLGEAYTAFQRYLLDLSRRGVILAVCSKNDEKNALEPFEKHPEMVLKRQDIACFIANWNDKASNLREIAKLLNIGLDALVFVDDNPFERNQVRAELPMVAVPEMPDDPTYYSACLASAGYFEAVSITNDDIARTRLYQENAIRASERAAAGNIDEYLRGLNMELEWAPFDNDSITRVTQLINKTNQFNLTTRRLSLAEVQSYADNADAITLQMRLLDRYGDNGIISVIIAAPTEANTLHIDTWLMSCRVLGRGVEAAAMTLLIAEAKARGINRLTGEYIATEKNGMVKDHYSKLDFEFSHSHADTHTFWSVDVGAYTPKTHFINIRKA